MKIGILVVATGKYISFAEPLWESVKKYFFTGKGDKVSMFVFTDAEKTPSGTIRCFQEHKKFPAPTLFRYEWFLKQKKALSKMDYLFYCDADMLFKANVGKEILGELVATQHPGFYTKPRKTFTYEKRKESLAFIPENKGINYFCGGFQGGTSKAYIRLCETLAQNIRNDLKKGITAEHNEESHFNSYLVNHKPDVILSPAYCLPEQLTTKYQKDHPEDKTNYFQWFPETLKEFSDKPKLIALLKDHNVIRYSETEALVRGTYDLVYKKIYELVSKIRDVANLPKHLAGSLKFKIMRDYPQFWTWRMYSQKLNPTKHINCESEFTTPEVLDLVTIGFNNSAVIETQIKLLKKNLKDNFSYTVADNSSNQTVRSEIEKICLKYNVGYISLPENKLSLPGLGNLSHGSAMTWVYKNYISYRPARYFGYLDHDIFPIKKTSLLKDFKKSPVLGIRQPRETTWYLWAGFCFFDKKFIGKKELNFLSKKYGNERLDTGGANWGPIYSGINPDTLPVYKHHYLNLTGGDIAQHDMVEYFGDWLHLFNASDWYKMDLSKKIKRESAIINLLKKYGSN